MTTAITDSEIDALTSADNKLLLRVLKLLYDLLNESSLIKTSTAGGVDKITIPADPFQVTGSDQACSSALLIHASDNSVYINFSSVASANTFPVPKNFPIPCPVDNLNEINVFGTEADDIFVLWRN